MDVEKTSKDLVDECKVVSCEKERESGFCFQKYSKDEIFRIFHGSVYTPPISEFWEISKFRRKFRYFGVIFFGLHRGLRYVSTSNNNTEEHAQRTCAYNTHRLHAPTQF